MCDSSGVPLAATLTPGQANECKSAATLVDGVRIGRRRRPRVIAGDKGYSYPFVRQMLQQRRIRPLIPTKSFEPRQASFDRQAYRQRNIIERLVGWLKERRRLCTRFEKLASSYLAMVTLAFIEKCLTFIGA